jgi:hypothetical protein
MAGGSDDRWRQDENEPWFRDGRARASRPPQELENAGREAWNAATIAGLDPTARTPQELRALGARVLDARRQAPHGAPPSGPTRPTSGEPAALASEPSYLTKPAWVSDAVWGALMQAQAAVRGATNVLTFGGADHLAAGVDALVGGGFDHWRQRYIANLAQERARDHYDALNRSGAQAAGQVGGTLLGVGLVGPVEGALGTAPRLAGAARLTSREVAAVLGGGALTGLGMQTASDVLAGGRRSSLGDKAGAALGGAAGAAALPLGPARAGAVGGWVMSAAQDALNGRPISLDRAGKSAMAGGIFGGLAGKTGMRAANDLPSSAKGRLGEVMGDVRSTINGQRRAWGPKSRDYLAGDDYWYPDARSGSARFEDKFGYGAELSPNQARAQSLLGPDFRLYHFTPDDIGGVLSVPAAAVGSQAVGSNLGGTQ